MTTEARKRAVNRLQSIYALRAIYAKNYEEGLEAKKEGRPVAWCMMEPWSGPILNTMGFRCVYPENYSSVCAAAGAAAPFLERCESEGFPAHMCGYLRCCLGYTARMKDLGGEIPPEAPGGGMPKPMLLLSSGYICDARFKGFQALGRYLDVPVYTLECPAPGPREALMNGTYEQNVGFLVKEIRKFVTFLERLVGEKMDWDKLERARKETEEANKAWYEVNALRTARPGPMHSRDLWSSTFALTLGGSDYKTIAELYHRMYDEVKCRVESSVSGINREERYRVTFEGLPPWHCLWFFDKLAERGWNFVTESAYHPSKPIEVDVTGINDPAERYVRSRYHGLARRIDTDFEPEEAARIKEEIRKRGFSHEPSIKHVRDHQCDGAFMHPLLTCRSATAGLNLLQYQLMEELKVPSLVVEGDIIDTSLFDPVEALRKAEAFEEIMDHYKKVRREAGLVQ